MRQRLATVTLMVAGILALPGVGAHAAELEMEVGTFKMKSLGAGGSVPFKGPVIKVEYDRDVRRYTQIKTTQLDFPVQVDMDCGGGGWKFSFATIEAAGATTDMSVSQLIKTGSGWYGTTWASPYYKPPSGVGDPVQICNSGLEAILAQGQHGKAQKGWAKKYYNAYLVKATLGCSKPAKKKKFGFFSDPPALSTDSDDAKFPVWVHCLPAPVFKTSSGAKPTGKKAGLQSAEVWINPKGNADYKGQCPKTLTFGGKADFLKSSQASPYELRYRYRTADGDNSPILKTTYTQSGEKVLKSWQKTFGSPAPGGIAFKATGASSSGAKVINSWIKLEILSSKPPYQVLATRQGNHRLTCVPAKKAVKNVVSGGGGGGGGVTPIKPVIMAAPAKPDLYIASADEHPAVANALIAIVGNKGKAASKATRITLFYLRSGRVMKKVAAVPALQPGRNVRVVVDAGSPLAAASGLKLHVDMPGNANAESDEKNNELKVE